mmetsp:Transcript_13286/g.38579  ORF Transcript_13286/g.38579 Transcript_13286/m.38579 type:complete len:492 (+) Transcript_13286:1166-2641(+)
MHPHIEQKLALNRVCGLLIDPAGAHQTRHIHQIHRIPPSTYPIQTLTEPPVPERNPPAGPLKPLSPGCLILHRLMGQKQQPHLLKLQCLGTRMLQTPNIQPGLRILCRIPASMPRHELRKCPNVRLIGRHKPIARQSLCVGPLFRAKSPIIPKTLTVHVQPAHNEPDCRYRKAPLDQPQHVQVPPKLGLPLAQLTLPTHLHQVQVRILHLRQPARRRTPAPSHPGKPRRPRHEPHSGEEPRQHPHQPRHPPGSLLLHAIVSQHTLQKPIQPFQHTRLASDTRRLAHRPTTTLVPLCAQHDKARDAIYAVLHNFWPPAPRIRRVQAQIQRLTPPNVRLRQAFRSSLQLALDRCTESAARRKKTQNHRPLVKFELGGDRIHRSVKKTRADVRTAERCADRGDGWNRPVLILNGMRGKLSHLYARQRRLFPSRGPKSKFKTALARSPAPVEDELQHPVVKDGLHPFQNPAQAVSEDGRRNPAVHRLSGAPVFTP